MGAVWRPHTRLHWPPLDFTTVACAIEFFFEIEIAFGLFEDATEGDRFEFVIKLTIVFAGFHVGTSFLVWISLCQGSNVSGDNLSVRGLDAEVNMKSAKSVIIIMG